jgi:hypothetical protein
MNNEMLIFLVSFYVALGSITWGWMFLDVIKLDKDNVRLSLAITIITFGSIFWPISWFIGIGIKLKELS